MLFIRLLVCTANEKINNIVKLANFSDNRARNMKFSSFGGAGAGEHIVVGLVQISKIFATQDDFLYVSMPFNGV